MFELLKYYRNYKKISPKIFMAQNLWGWIEKNCNALNTKTLDPRHRVTVTVTGSPARSEQCLELTWNAWCKFRRDILRNFFLMFINNSLLRFDFWRFRLFRFSNDRYEVVHKITQFACKSDFYMLRNHMYCTHFEPLNFPQKFWNHWYSTLFEPANFSREASYDCEP